MSLRFSPDLQARDKGLGEAFRRGREHAAPARADARRHRADGHDVDEPRRKARAAHMQTTSGARGSQRGAHGLDERWFMRLGISYPQHGLRATKVAK